MHLITKRPGERQGVILGHCIPAAQQTISLCWIVKVAGDRVTVFFLHFSIKIKKEEEEMPSSPCQWLCSVGLGWGTQPQAEHRGWVVEAETFGDFGAELWFCPRLAGAVGAVQWGENGVRVWSLSSRAALGDHGVVLGAAAEQLIH